MDPATSNLSSLDRRVESFARTLGVFLWIFAIGALAWTLLYRYHTLQMGAHDFGVYTNFLWNSAHGDLFRFFVDENYLKTHLSFSLLLLAPLYHVWDHPLLLPYVQLALVVFGSFGLALMARRLGLSTSVAVGLGFAMTASPFTQSTLMHAFHGVSTYYVLIPCLYGCLVWRRQFAWIPVALIAGLREDAFLAALPMLLYFARRDRWRGGYLLAGGAALYGILALTVIFPWINDVSLLSRRAQDIAAPGLGLFHIEKLSEAAVSLGYLFLPAALLLGRQVLPIIVFPAFTMLQMLGSSRGMHYAFMNHYSAFVIPMIFTGILEALRRRSSSSTERIPGYVIGLFLISSIIVTHMAWDPYPPKRLRERRVQLDTLRNWPPAARAAEYAARRVPKQGRLLADDDLVTRVTNRRDLLATRAGIARYAPDVVFAALPGPSDSRISPLLRYLESDEYGVVYSDSGFVILQRGSDPTPNRDVGRAIVFRTNLVSFGTSEGPGRSVYAPGAIRVRVLSPADGVLNAGPLRLSAGRYAAYFRLRTEAAAGAESFGHIGIAVTSGSPSVFKSAIESIESPEGVFREQVVHFELSEPREIRPQVWPGATPLWLDRCLVVPIDG